MNGVVRTMSAAFPASTMLLRRASLTGSKSSASSSNESARRLFAACAIAGGLTPCKSFAAARR